MTPKSDSQPLLAVAFMLLASALLAGTSLLAKALGQDILGVGLHPLQISHGRFIFAFILISSFVAFLRPKFGPLLLPIHIARTASGWMGITLIFASIAYIPLSDAQAISFLNPVFAMVLAIPILGERVGPIRWLAAGIALAGAMVLLRPTPETFQPAALLALGAAVLTGFEITLIKMLSGRQAPLQILFTNNGLGAMISSVAVLFVWVMPTPAQWIALVSLGGMMALAQSCFIQSMKRGEASFVAPVSFSALVFAMLLDYLIFGVVPDGVSFIGSAIIVGGAVLLAVREARAKRR
ncbi:DMT family transporter [Cochlodiniinecator piscidefendens]|uniref:DMT family transporter n=1 Tax=Cochlodiniinecator piscidefendens TaxID=2715756 RepID=UPI00140A9A30|nr:DMT family transporter [Cochlodiniinecator piscidefendens]